MKTCGSDLRRKHTEPYFWRYALFYVLIGSGAVIWLGELIATRSPATSGVGIIGMLMGLLVLAGTQNRRLKGRIDELENKVCAVENPESQDP